VNKKNRLLSIIKEIQNMYPHLDRLMVTDLDNPVSIIITSEENLENIAEDYGIEMEEVTEFFQGDSLEDQLDQVNLFTNSDDDDKGTLQ